MIERLFVSVLSDPAHCASQNDHLDITAVYACRDNRASATYQQR